MSPSFFPNLPPYEDIDDNDWRALYESTALAITARSKTHWPEWREMSPAEREGFQHTLYARLLRHLADRDDT